MTDPAIRPESTYAVTGEDLAYLLRSVVPILPAPEWPRLARAVASARSAIDGALTRQRATHEAGGADAESVLASNRSELARAAHDLICVPPNWPDTPWPWPWPWPWPGPWPWPLRPDGGPDLVMDATELPAIALLAAGAQFWSASTLLTSPAPGAPS